MSSFNKLILREIVAKVARAFYNDNPANIIILDILASCNSISEDELVTRVYKTKNGKELNKICGFLRQQGLIKTEDIQPDKEDKKDGIKPERKKIRNTYYIDYKQFLDVVKWKIHKISSRLRNDSIDSAEASFICRSCETRYAALEVMNLLTPDGILICANEACNGKALDQEEEVLQIPGDSNELHTRFLMESKVLIDLLRQTDKMRIPEYDPKAGLKDLPGKITPNLPDSTVKGAQITQIKVEFSDALNMFLSRPPRVENFQKSVAEEFEEFLVSMNFVACPMDQNSDFMDEDDDDFSKGGFPLKIDFIQYPVPKRPGKSKKKSDKEGDVAGYQKYPEVGKDHCFLHVRFSDVEGDLPVVVFESHLGMTMHVWQEIEFKLRGVLPTLVYERQGYGLSSPLHDHQSPRTADEIARDLYALLCELDLIKPKGKGREFIFVAHSENCRVNTFKSTTTTPLTNPITLTPTLHKTLPSVLHRTKWIAAFGGLRFLDWIGISFLPKPRKSTNFASVRGEMDGNDFGYCVRTVETMFAEVCGMPRILDDVGEFYGLDSGGGVDGGKREVGESEMDGKVRVLTPEILEPPAVNIGKSMEEWNKWWYEQVEEFGWKLQQELLTGDGKSRIRKHICKTVEKEDSIGLCSNGAVIESVLDICKSNGYEIKFID
ncbi:hypothetical protein HK098_008186 [Nowakowskiella sp. JEL0407]|nr:hypothetical protein HK098_008186 [Nowakowskiella sp. JEL0407]